MTKEITEFEKPWHAQITAIAQTLIEAGAFNETQWSRTLGQFRDLQAKQGTADTEDAYFDAVFKATVMLLEAHTDDLNNELQTAFIAWRDAYLNTPHGQPVSLDVEKLS